MYHYNVDFNKPEGIKKDGNWIMIIKLIPVAIPIRPYSIFFATPNPRKIRNPRYGDAGCITVEWNFTITTDYGDVVIREGEYSLLTDERLREYIECVKDGDYSIVMYNIDGNKMLSQKLQDSIFYIRSRGISYTDALLMSIGLVNSRSVFRLEVHMVYLEHFLREPELELYLNHVERFKPEQLKDIYPIEQKTVIKKKKDRSYFRSKKDAETELDLLVNEYFNGYDGNEEQVEELINDVVKEYTKGV